VASLHAVGVEVKLYVGCNINVPGPYAFDRGVIDVRGAGGFVFAGCEWRFRVPRG
jgi:hypothetical protein